MTGPGRGGGPPVVVVGAGIAGAAAALEVTGAGHRVLMLDRGRRVGGRMAVHTVAAGTAYDGRPVDVGASYLTAAEHDVVGLVDGWVARGLAHPWTDTFAVAGPHGITGTRPGPLRYGTSRGLRSLVEDLLDRIPAQLLDLRHPVDVASVGLDDHDRPVVDGEPAAAVVLAMPDPQARRLLHPVDPRLRSTRLATKGVLWEPAVVLVAGYDERCWPEFDGAFVNDDDVLTWIADDGRRRGDGAPVLVAHAAAVPSTGALDDPGSLVPSMLDGLRRVLGVSETPAWTWVHRWSYARPVTAWPEPFHLDPVTRLALAGDGWHGGPRIGAAWMSGRAAGRAVARLLEG